MKKSEPVTLSDVAFTRLTFRRKGDTKSNHRWVYDARGYQFVHYPTTGDILTEPKDSIASHMDTGILFDCYNDGWDKFFAFYTGDCFDPPMKLIIARTWEEADEIFCDEYADLVPNSDIEDEAKSVAKGEIVEWSDLTDEAKRKRIESVEEDWSNCGMITTMSSMREGAENPWVYSEGVQGFELELTRAEVLP